jgi:hypothetical protein
MQNPSRIHLFRTALPLLSIPSRQRRSREIARLLSSLMRLKTNGLPSRSPSLLLLKQGLSLLFVSSTERVVGLLTSIALRSLFILLLLLPELGLLPAFAFPAVKCVSEWLYSH